jgi:hypothetical protein
MDSVGRRAMAPSANAARRGVAEMVGIHFKDCAIL